MLLAILLAACVTVVAGECTVGDRWYLPPHGESVPGDDWLVSLRNKPVILIGEHHDNNAHHLWQLRILKTLLDAGDQPPRFAVGFEMLPRSRQESLDRWFLGHEGKQNLKQDLQWDSVWGFDFDYYYPLMEHARLRAAGMLALNAEADLVARVRTDGWEQTPPALRQGLLPPAPPSREYLRLLASSFLGHVPPGAQPEDGERKQRFLRFVQGQLVWDSVMAQSIAQARQRHPELGVIAFMGSWHMIDGGGVPYQLAQLGVTQVSVIVPWDAHLDCAGINPGYADAIYGLDYRTR